MFEIQRQLSRFERPDNLLFYVTFVLWFQFSETRFQLKYRAEHGKLWQFTK